ncbi:MAG: copper chaperone PCu(A)C [Vicinamibacterales bacterium]
MTSRYERLVRRVVLLLALLVSDGLGGTGWLVGRTAAAQDQPVTTSDAWVRVPAAGAAGAVVVMTIDNPGMYEFFVASGTSDAADTVEFRDAGRDNAVLEYITCPPGEPTYLDPKGVHVYLSGLKRPLNAGDRVRLRLKTSNGVEFDVDAEAKSE